MVTKTIFTIFSSSNERWRYDITSMDVTKLQSTHFFSRNLLLLPSSRPVLYSHGLIAEHVPYRKSKSGLRTFTPACQFTSFLPKLQTLHSLFFNSKHRVSTFQIFIRQFNHELSVSHYWSKAGWRHLIREKCFQMVMNNRSFPISKLYLCVNP